MKEPKIPAIVRVIKDDTDALEKSYIENVQRVDLTSVEDENTVNELWDSKRYKTQEQLAKKLGLDNATISRKLHADKVRDNLNLGPRISTTTIDETRGLSDEPRKKILESIEKKKIKSEDLTSIERENAIGSLWDSGRYETHRKLAKKLGYGEDVVAKLISAKEFRKSVATTVSTRTLTDTQGLSDEPRKKILKQIEEKKIKADDVRDVVRKVKDFPDPEQQMEILQEYEDQEDTSREMFNSIVQKKKEIAEGNNQREKK